MVSPAVSPALPGQESMEALGSNAVHINTFYEVWCPVCLHSEMHEDKADAKVDAARHGEHCEWLAERPAGYYGNRNTPRDRIFPTKL